MERLKQKLKDYGYFNFIFHLVMSVLLILSLVGCATTEKPYVEVSPIKPEAKIMKDCGDYILPKNTQDDFVRAISKNQDTFNECKNQNQGKKVFIEKVTK